MTQLAETSPSAEHAEAARCWICGGARLRLVKPSNLPEALHPEALRITDANNCLTADIFRCEAPILAVSQCAPGSRTLREDERQLV